MNCELCDLNMEIQEIVVENEHCLFIQLYQQEIIGSGLIIPKKHRETVFDLTVEEWESTYQILKLAKERIDQLHKPDGYNVGWNCGSTAGQHIHHAHLHIIPRYRGEPYAGKGIRHWFKSAENKRRNQTNS